MPLNDMVRFDDINPVYTRSVAAKLAQISLDFMRRCEEEHLIHAHLMAGGGYGYSIADIRHLTLIRRLREELGLDLSGIGVVLNMRGQILDLRRHLDEQQRWIAQREQELLNEIQHLRQRLAEEARWW